MDDLTSAETRAMTDHPDAGYAALKAKADAVYKKNAEAVAAKVKADKAAEDAADAAEAKAAKKASK
jgi:hypothetical protein